MDSTGELPAPTPAPAPPHPAAAALSSPPDVDDFAPLHWAAWDWMVLTLPSVPQRGHVTRPSASGWSGTKEQAMHCFASPLLWRVHLGQAHWLASIVYTHLPLPSRHVRGVEVTRWASCQIRPVKRRNLRNPMWPLLDGAVHVHVHGAGTWVAITTSFFLFCSVLHVHVHMAETNEVQHVPFW